MNIDLQNLIRIHYRDRTIIILDEQLISQSSDRLPDHVCAKGNQGNPDKTVYPSDHAGF